MSRWYSIGTAFKGSAITKFDEIIEFTSLTYIAFEAFMGSTLLNMSVPSFITTISTRAFSECSQLESVTLPNTTKTIGIQVFKTCPNLTSVTVYADTPPTLGADGFTASPNHHVYVPNGAVAAYKAANQWMYWNIEAIPQ